MGRELPSGTVTFLFSDVEGSTRLLQEHGDAYPRVLAEHRRLLREAFARHDGVEVDTQGDAFFVAFARASDALAAAHDAQAALEATPVRVRIGIHTGEPVVTEEGYAGLDVHKGARIAAAGHGGQILVSEQTARLVAPEALRELGTHRLKDLTAPERIYQVGRGQFAPLKTLNATNLPVAASPLIGRHGELTELTSLLANGTRLVTVTGPGGTGKTRFALQGAAELVETFTGGVFWVPLQAVSDASLVVPTIAHAVGGGDDLAGHLRAKRTLLLLDNLEHLLDAAPELAALLGDCPDLRLLVTSRAPLRIDGEHELPLDPLPDDEAATLFVERARAAGRRVEADAAVAEICRRLDNLPLALELAAARAKLLEPRALLGRLEHSLPVLTGGRRDAPERQRTLRATIEWSYDLLDDGAKDLFARLAVFAGGFSFEAAEKVCDAGFDELAALVDLALLKPVGEDRFLMLETIHEYADERLRARDDGDRVERRHAEYFADFAQECLRLRRFVGGSEHFGRLEAEQANVRAALARATRLRDPTLQLRILTPGTALFLRGSQGDFRAALEAALEAGTDEPMLEASAQAARSFVAYRQGDYAAARAAAERAHDIGSRIGDDGVMGMALTSLANPAVAEGKYEEARRLLAEASRRFANAGDARGERVTIVNSGDLSLRAGDYETARRLSLEGVALARQAGDVRMAEVGLINAASAATALGRLAEAAKHAGEALESAKDADDLANIACCLLIFAALAARRLDGERAALLFGASRRVYRDIELMVEPSEQVLLEDAARRIRDLLDDEERQAAELAGAALGTAQAVEVALGPAS